MQYADRLRKTEAQSSMPIDSSFPFAISDSSHRTPIRVSIALTVHCCSCRLIQKACSICRILAARTVHRSSAHLRRSRSYGTRMPRFGSCCGLRGIDLGCIVWSIQYLNNSGVVDSRPFCADCLCDPCSDILCVCVIAGCTTISITFWC